MKKKFTVLSSIKCAGKGCEKYLKQNLVDKNPDAEYCYKCYPKSKINRDGRSGKSD